MKPTTYGQNENDMQSFDWDSDDGDTSPASLANDSHKLSYVTSVKLFSRLTLRQTSRVGSNLSGLTLNGSLV